MKKERQRSFFVTLAFLYILLYTNGINKLSHSHIFLVSVQIARDDVNGRSWGA